MGDTLGAQPKHGYETKFHNNWRTGCTFKALNIQFVRHLVIEWNTDALGWWPARQTNQPWKSKAMINEWSTFLHTGLLKALAMWVKQQ